MKWFGWLRKKEKLETAGNYKETTDVMAKHFKDHNIFDPYKNVNIKNWQKDMMERMINAPPGSFHLIPISRMSKPKSKDCECQLTDKIDFLEKEKGLLELMNKEQAQMIEIQANEIEKLEQTKLMSCPNCRIKFEFFDHSSKFQTKFKNKPR